jgi:hypothetical protein
MAIFIVYALLLAWNTSCILRADTRSLAIYSNSFEIYLALMINK